MNKHPLKQALKEIILSFYNVELPAATPRHILLSEHPRNATIITGMRRTGKTFLAFQRMNDLLASGVEKNQILYLNFEDDRLLGFQAEDFKSVTDIYYQAYPENTSKMCYFFLDEIQDIEHWASFARRLIDTPNIQLYLTGSSSKMLTSEIATAMRGRSMQTEVFPFSLGEFLIHNKIIPSIPKHMTEALRNKIQHGMDAYFMVGGFPDVQGYPENERTQKLQEYVHSVIFRDVVDRHRVQYSQMLKYLMGMLFNNPSTRISVHRISGALKAMGIPSDRDAISQYLDFLGEAYLIYRVRLHTDSVAKRRMNPDKYYIIDQGLIRAMTSKHSSDMGHLLENVVFMHLRRMGYIVEYVETRDKSEVDFLAYHQTRRDYRLIQVCYHLETGKTAMREISALRKAGEEMNISNRLIVTWDEEAELDHGIQVMPIWKFLLPPQ